MQANSVDTDRGFVALHAGDWQSALTAFEATLAERETPEALEGLSEALWWVGDEDRALSFRQRAHAAFRRRGDRARAVRCALWVSDQYRQAYGDEAAAKGWFGRAERLLDDASAASATGWMALARASRAGDPATSEQFARQALVDADRWSDAELEAYALAELGLARVASGEVSEGLAELNEAMAVATSQDNLMVAGDTACLMMQAAELIGDLSPFMSWGSVMERYLFQHGHSALIASCGTCCGQVFASNGDWTNAEGELLRAIHALESTGRKSRCSHPTAALASLRIRQGRLEDAESILAPYATLPEAVEPMAELFLAQGRPGPAVRLVERRLVQLGGDNLRAVPLLSVLAQAQAAQGNSDAAAHAARRLAAMAEKSGLDRVRGLAALAKGRSLSQPTQAQTAYKEAIDLLDAAGAPLEAATARLEYAELVSDADHDYAVAEARAANSAFDRLGASQLADRAVALLRRLGVRGQTGTKRKARLTEREAEVLNLIALGMTNAEIAERLFISQKTAANHVSNVLMKLGVRSRTEAAALALRE